MDKNLNPVKVVADNLKRLKQWRKDRGEPHSAEDIGKKAGVGHGTVDRATKGAASLTVANLEAIAKAYGLNGWQLLVPNLDPDNPPALRIITESEAKLYKQLQSLAKEITRTPTVE